MTIIDPKCDIKLVCINARSIRYSKIDEYFALINSIDNSVHIILMTETWLYSSEVDYYNLPGYNAVFNCRTENIGGGTIIFVRKDMEFTVLQQNPHFNTILIELLNFSAKIKILVAYKAPHENTSFR
jgi:hypothetical protein